MTQSFCSTYPEPPLPDYRDALSKRKVLKPAKVGTVTRADAKRAVKKVMEAEAKHKGKRC